MATAAADDHEELDILTDELKTKLHNLITSKLQFVESPADVICRHCDQIPIFHYIFPCQHPYCRECYYSYQKANMKCRVCRTEIGTQLEQSRLIEMTIYKLKAYCPNQECGCKEVIQLYKLLNHLDKCRFDKRFLLPVPYKEKDATDNLVLAEVADLKTTITEIVTRLNHIEETNQELVKDNAKLSADKTELNDEINKLKTDCAKLEENHKQFVERTRATIEQNQALCDQNAELVNDNKRLASECSEVVNTNSELIKRNSEVTQRNQELMNEYTKLAGTNQETINANKRQAQENEKLVTQIVTLQQESKQLTKTLTDKHNSLAKELNLLKEAHKNKELKESKRITDKSNLSSTSSTNTNKGTSVKKKTMPVSPAKNTTRVTDKPKTTPFRRTETAQGDDLGRDFQKEEQLIIQLREEVKTLKQELKTAVWFKWEITDYQLKRVLKAQVSSGHFRSNDGCHQVVLRMTFDTSSINVRLVLTSETASAAGSGQSGHPHFRMTLLILDQSPKTDSHRPITYVAEPTIADSSSASLDYLACIIPFSPLLDGTDTDRAYLLNNAIQIRALVEPITKLLAENCSEKVVSRTGTLHWIVDHYERTKQESLLGINKYVYSGYFYSAPKGYRMKARMWWWTDFLKISLTFLPGEFDKQLAPTPPVHQCKVTVVGQNEDGTEKCSQRFTTLEASPDVDRHFVFFQCVKVEDVAFIRRVKDDSLTIRIDVERKS